MPNLNERRHQQTRSEIAAAAIGLFAERGFDAVTMEEVAAAAGASRRTVYRHFPSKDDLMFERPRSWVQHFDDVVADARPGDSGLDRCVRALRSVADRIDAEAESVHAGFQAYLETPSLRASRARLDDEMFSRIYALADADLPDADNKTTNAAVIAGALVGTLNGVLVAWAAQWPEHSMTEIMDHALEQVRPMLNRQPTSHRSPGSTARG